MNNTKQTKNEISTPPFPKGAGGIYGRHLPYNKNLKQLSRNLRNNSTQSEILLWKELRAANFGYTFNRQKPILDYIVDFYCKPLPGNALCKIIHTIKNRKYTIIGSKR